jgi:hypothetical protein
MRCEATELRQARTGPEFFSWIWKRNFDVSAGIKLALTLVIHDAVTTKNLKPDSSSEISLKGDIECPN